MKRQLVSLNYPLPAGWCENEQQTSLLSWGGLEVGLLMPLIHTGVGFFFEGINTKKMPPFNI